jgi:hypothetical protein
MHHLNMCQTKKVIDRASGSIPALENPILSLRGKRSGGLTIFVQQRCLKQMGASAPEGRTDGVWNIFPAIVVP